MHDAWALADREQHAFHRFGSLLGQRHMLVFCRNGYYAGFREVSFIRSILLLLYFHFENNIIITKTTLHHACMQPGVPPIAIYSSQHTSARCTCICMHVDDIRCRPSSSPKWLACSDPFTFTDRSRRRKVQHREETGRAGTTVQLHIYASMCNCAWLYVHAWPSSRQAIDESARSCVAPYGDAGCWRHFY